MGMGLCWLWIVWRNVDDERRRRSRRKTRTSNENYALKSICDAKLCDVCLLPCHMRIMKDQLKFQCFGKKRRNFEDDILADTFWKWNSKRFLIIRVKEKSFNWNDFFCGLFFLLPSRLNCSLILHTRKWRRLRRRTTSTRQGCFKYPCAYLELILAKTFFLTFFFAFTRLDPRWNHKMNG